MNRQNSPARAGHVVDLWPRKNVECIQGDAVATLPRILARDDFADALVFLDGHSSGTHTAGGQTIEPACAEIAILGDHVGKVAALVVVTFVCMVLKRSGRGSRPC